MVDAAGALVSDGTGNHLVSPVRPSSLVETVYRSVFPFLNFPGAPLSFELSPLTSDADPVTVRSWSDVCNVGPALSPVILANTKHLYNIYTTSVQRLRRWTLYKYNTNVLCLLGCSSCHPTPISARKKLDATAEVARIISQAIMLGYERTRSLHMSLSVPAAAPRH